MSERSTKLPLFGCANSEDSCSGKLSRVVFSMALQHAKKLQSKEILVLSIAAKKATGKVAF
jgi:hypothetical protein